MARGGSVIYLGHVMTRRLAIAFATTLLACSTNTPETRESAPPPGDPPPANDAPALTCAEAEAIPLHVAQRGEDRWLFAEVDHEGKKALLSFDTGSPLTFVHPESGEKSETAKKLGFGCTTKTVKPYPVPSPGNRVDGLLQIGILGADMILTQPTVLDLAPAAPRLTRFSDRAALPDTSNFWSATFDVVKTQMIVSAVVDGTTYRLLVDTGAPHILLLGQTGRAQDRPATAKDAFGSVLDLFVGDSVVAFAGEPDRVLKVYRTTSLPHLEDKIRYIGAPIDGLLGLSVFETRRVLVDGEKKELKIERRPASAP
jgi:hypothetical protein